MLELSDQLLLVLLWCLWYLFVDECLRKGEGGGGGVRLWIQVDCLPCWERCCVLQLFCRFFERVLHFPNEGSSSWAGVSSSHCPLHCSCSWSLLRWKRRRMIDRPSWFVEHLCWVAALCEALVALPSAMRSLHRETQSSLSSCSVFMKERSRLQTLHYESYFQFNQQQWSIDRQAVTAARHATLFSN